MSPSTPVTAVLAKLGRVKRSGTGWSAKCPAHDDKAPSLSVSEGADGRALLTCHAGCDLEAICAALKIDVSDLFVEAPSEDSHVVISHYDYTDESGSIVFRVERLFPKSFRQCKPNGKGGWTYKLGSGRRPLYRLPKVVEAMRADRPVWVVEGERDVASLEALGEVATTNAGGAKAWRPEHTQSLAGAAVRIICDRDAEGRKHAESVGQSLRDVGCRVEMFEPVEGKDITDHLHAGRALSEIVAYGTAKPTLSVVPTGEPELISMIRDGDTVIGESAMPGAWRLDFEASNVRRGPTGTHATVTISTAGEQIAYDSLNIERMGDRTRLANGAAKRLGDPQKGSEPIRLRLDAFCARVWGCWVAADAPNLARGNEMAASRTLLEPYLTDSRTILFAPGGSGKSWLAIIWALHLRYGLSQPWQATEQTDVLFLDFEDTRQVFEARLAQAATVLGCPAELPYYGAEGRGFLEVWDSIRAYVEDRKIGLVIIDSISRLGLGKLVEDQSATTGIDRLNRLGVPWLALAHTPHHSGDHVFGSVHWENGARVVVKGEASESPVDDGLIGLRLSVTKANHIRRGQHSTWAFRFEENRLVEHRRALASDFPDLPDERPVRERIRDYLSSVGQAPLEEICEWTESSDRTVRRALLDGEGTEFERIASGTGRGHKAVWRRHLVAVIG